MIPGFLKTEIEKKLKDIANSDASITKSLPVSGGCINTCFQVQTTAGDYFLKYNDVGKYPQMFEAELKGLELLKDANAIPVPGVIFNGEVNGTSFLVLEWIEPGRRNKDSWSYFGKHLAKLHRSSVTNYGLGYNNYIGSLKQSNVQQNSWTDFFIHERIEPQLKLANEKGLIGNAMITQFNNLYRKLNELIPEEKPALLHGDLWNGNFLVNDKGLATLIDPAVYYGHREMDLAMTKLFGGFDMEFYSAYDESFPLDKGFEDRIDIHNLYPLLVHVNLFGGGYVQQVKAVLERFA